MTSEERAELRALCERLRVEASAGWTDGIADLLSRSAAALPRLLNALERKDTALRAIDGPCEHVHNGRCSETAGFTDDSDEWATRTCDPCIAHRALTDGRTPEGGRG